MKVTLLIFVVLSFFSLDSYAQGILWSNHCTGTGQNIPVEMVSDADGNVYVAGVFNGTINDTDPAKTSRGNSDAYLAKYSQDGDLLWFLQIGGTGVDNSTGLVLNGDGDAVYISGMFQTTCTFGTGNQIVSVGSSDLYLAKINADGSVAWARNAAYGNSNQLFGNITLGENDDILMVGKFDDDVTFYGGVLGLSSPDNAILQGFIAKFNQDGDPAWSKLVVFNNTGSVLRTVTYCNGNFFISGMYRDQIIFDIATISNDGSNLDVFMYSINSSGNGLWIRKIQGGGDDYCWKHVTGRDDYQYLTGYFNSPMLSIDSTSTLISEKTYTNHGLNDILYAKYSTTGELQWARIVGSAQEDYSYSMCASTNEIYLMGQSQNVITFGSSQFASRGMTDAYVVKDDQSGAYSSLFQAFGRLDDNAKAICFNPTGRSVYLAFEFYSDSLFVNGDTLLNPNPAVRDGYIARYGCFEGISMSATDVTCVDEALQPVINDGTATATPSAETGPYSYSWSNGGTTATITGLAPGTYNVTVTGSFGCTATGSVTVGKPSVALTATISTIGISCNGQCDGEATVLPENGYLPYSYSWDTDPIQTTSTISSLCGGNYNVTVTDLKGCTVTKTAVIEEPAVLAAGVSSTNVTCPGGNNGSASVTPSGGISPYSYYWNSTPPQTTATATNLTQGTYTCTISDANGCSIVKTKIVTTLERPVTKLKDTHCGATFTSMADFIGCDPLTSAVDYEYNFVNTSIGYDQTVVRGSSSSTLYLNTVPGLIYGYTYDVRVKVKTDDLCGPLWGEYGTMCQITLQNTPLTQLRSAYCNAVVGDLNSYILIDPVSGATDFQYNFVNIGLGYDQTVTRGSSTTSLYLNTVPGLRYGETYDVKVKVYASGWGDYGNVCQITLPPFPSTRLNDSYCNKTVANTGATVYCLPVAGASNYQYNFVHAATGYDVTYTRGMASTQLKLSNVPGLTSGKTYNVKVKAYVNGVWGDFGTICQLTVGGTKEALVSPEVVVPVSLSAYPNPFGETVTLLMEGPSDQTAGLVMYDITGKVVESLEIKTNTDYVLGEGIKPGVYLVKVTSGNYTETLKLIKTK